MDNRDYAGISENVKIVNNKNFRMVIETEALKVRSNGDSIIAESYTHGDCVTYNKETKEFWFQPYLLNPRYKTNEQEGFRRLSLEDLYNIELYGSWKCHFQRWFLPEKCNDWGIKIIN
jgi:hypothetical protein